MCEEHQLNVVDQAAHHGNNSRRGSLPLGRNLRRGHPARRGVEHRMVWIQRAGVPHLPSHEGADFKGNRFKNERQCW